MYQFYVFEIQTYADGTYGHIVHPVYDTDETAARLKAESKYYEVLAAAAISELPEHGAILVRSNCMPMMNKVYTHIQPEPEPEA